MTLPKAPRKQAEPKKAAEIIVPAVSQRKSVESLPDAVAARQFGGVNVSEAKQKLLETLLFLPDPSRHNCRRLDSNEILFDEDLDVVRCSKCENPAKMITATSVKLDGTIFIFRISIEKNMFCKYY